MNKKPKTQASQAGQMEPFAKGDSWLHLADPRAKLYVALALSLVTALGRDLAVLGVCLAAGALLTASARLAPRLLFKRLLVVNGFIALLWVFMPIELTWGSGGLTAGFQPAAWREAFRLTLKANAIILMLLALLGTSPVNQLLHGLAHMRIPNKLLHLFLFFYRYLHVLSQERKRLGLAMKVRGFKPGSNLHTYRTYANLVGTLLVRGYDRAERVYQAMLCRGFSGTYWLLDHFHWQKRDSLLLWGGLAFAAGVELLFWRNTIWS